MLSLRQIPHLNKLRETEVLEYNLLLGAEGPSFIAFGCDNAADDVDLDLALASGRFYSFYRIFRIGRIAHASNCIEFG
jgi:hypothetical protein